MRNYYIVLNESFAINVPAIRKLGIPNTSFANTLPGRLLLLHFTATWVLDIQDWQDLPVCGICRIRRICRNCRILQFAGFAGLVGSARLAGSSSLRDLIVRLSGKLVWDVDDQRELDLTRVLIRIQRHWLEGIDKNARIYLMSQRNDIIIILENTCVVPDPIDLS